MKTKIIFLNFIAFAIFLSVQSQISKVETYLTGTKISYYINQCGNSIPEAQNKLSFCDANNNLGVVEESLGLNYRGVINMIANFSNQNECYVTNNGLSIRKENGTWENIPNIAMPNYTSLLPTNIKNGIVQPNGNIIIFFTNNQSSMVEYNPSLKTITSHAFSVGYYPAIITYDTDNQISWILARNSSNIKLYSFNGTSLIDFGVISGLPTNASGSNLKMIYRNQKLYFGYNGLYVLDISDTSNLTFTKYDTQSTLALPLDIVNDFTIDNNGIIWLSQIASYNGYITKLDITNTNVQSYQANHPDTGNVLAFKSIAVDNNNNFFALATNYSGLITFNLDVNGAPIFNFIEKTTIEGNGFPYVYVPHNVYYTNNKFYFITSDYSSGSNENYEVIIFDGYWDGRNDNEAGNLSQKENTRFKFNHPDNLGGMWWFNTDDNLVLHRDINGNHQSMDLANISWASAVDIDNKAIVKGGNPNEIRKIDFPNANSIQAIANSADEIVYNNGEIWIYSKNDPKIDIYQNDNLINTYNLDLSDYQYYYNMVIADDGNPYFFRQVGNTLTIRSFNLNTQTSTSIDFTLNTNLVLSEIIAAPNNALWIYGYLGACYYQNGAIYEFQKNDYPNEIIYINDAVVDTNGKFIFSNSATNHGSIGTIENPTDVTPIVTNQLISSQYGNPLLTHFKEALASISIDSEGNIWSFWGGRGAVKLIDSDTAVEYRKAVLSTTGNQVKIDVHIYPNPTYNILNIDFNKSDNYSLIIYDIKGRKLIQKKNLSLNNQLDLSTIHSGIYFIKFTNKNKQTTTLKFVKL